MLLLPSFIFFVSQFSRYSCPEAPFKAYTDKCHLNGTFYRISEKVPEEFLPPCLAESICLNAFVLLFILKN